MNFSCTWNYGMKWLYIEMTKENTVNILTKYNVSLLNNLNALLQMCKHNYV